MPEAPFKNALADQDAGLACIEALRKACDTSLTATAIRYSALTSDGVAVICTTGDAVDWCFMSDGLKQAKGITFLRKGIGVPPGTVTAQFNAAPENIRTGQRDEGQRHLSDWMGGDSRYRITEEVVGLGQYGRTLTILTCKRLVCVLKWIRMTMTRRRLSIAGLLAFGNRLQHIIGYWRSRKQLLRTMPLFQALRAPA